MWKTKRTDKQQALLDYKRAAPIAIQETRDDEQARADRLEAAVIQAVRGWIWAQRPWCQLCQGSRRGECAGFPDEMHEEPSRAMTRGLPPEQRFNLIVCGRLCKACHLDVTEHRLTIRFEDPAAGFMRRVFAVAVTLLLTLASLASAQTTGVALSAQVGVLTTPSFDPALTVLGAFDVVLSPRVSLRPSASWDEPSNGPVSRRRVGLHWDVLYNWDKGGWRPFIGAGAGMHSFQSKVEGRVVGEHDQLNFGAAVSGGVEVGAVIVEAQYAAIEQGRLAQSPSALSVRVGLKHYF